MRVDSHPVFFTRRRSGLLRQNKRSERFLIVQVFVERPQALSGAFSVEPIDVNVSSHIAQDAYAQLNFVALAQHHLLAAKSAPDTRLFGTLIVDLQLGSA